MSCVLTRSREVGCFDNIGGIKAIYLFDFVKYPLGYIKGEKGVEITYFPNIQLFKYETRNANFSETINNDENGVSYNQTLTFTLFKQDVITTQQLNSLARKDFSYIVEFNDGNLKMGGVYNGARIENFTIDSGSSKASLNGYNITINGVEEYAAPFVFEGIFDDGYLLLQDDFYLLLQTNGKIIL